MDLGHRYVIEELKGWARVVAYNTFSLEPDSHSNEPGYFFKANELCAVEQVVGVAA